MYAHNKLLKLKSPPVIHIDEIKTLLCKMPASYPIYWLMQLNHVAQYLKRPNHYLLSIEWFGSNTILAYYI